MMLFGLVPSGGLALVMKNITAILNKAILLQYIKREGISLF
jgi:hypothetical protein